LNFVPNI